MSDQQTSQKIRVQVRESYGRIAEKFSTAAKTSCCPSSQASSCCAPTQEQSDQVVDKISQLYQAPEITELPEDVTGLSLGCGDPVTLASLQPGQTVLDLGSGGGIDCFLAAKRVGPNGHVIGVDMTPAMLDKARVNQQKLGAENVEFRLGEIEHLPVADSTVDVIISNCVINLSPDKPQVFREAFRVLKPGGKLAVSDIVTDGPLPEAIKADLSAWAGCVGGALDVQDYLAAIRQAGFVDIELSPVYFSQEMIVEAIDQLGESIPLENVPEDALSKTIFSAKIIARKVDHGG